MTDIDNEKARKNAERLLQKLGEAGDWFSDDVSSDPELQALLGKGEPLTLAELRARVAAIEPRGQEKNEGWSMAARDGATIDDAVLRQMKEDRDKARRARGTDDSESD
jgi:hypothetical protein